MPPNPNAAFDVSDPGMSGPVTAHAARTSPFSQAAAGAPHPKAHLIRPVPATGLPPKDTTELLVKVHDKWYDLQQWRFVHPGGPTILMHAHGTDVTDAFISLHSQEAIARLGKMRPVPEHKLPIELQTKDLTPTPYMLAYREWMVKLREDGMFTRTFYNEFTTGFPVIALFFIGVYFASSWPLLATFMIALSQQQAGWFGHDCVHGRGQYCNVMGRFISGWFGGMSRAWWSDKHNTHHCYTNCVGIDGDINNDPMIFNYPPKTEADVWYRRYQHLYAAMLYPLLYYSWRINSVKFCWAEKRYTEMATELLPSYLLLSLVPIPVALASIWLSGLFVAIVVTLSHESEEMFFDEPEEFLKAQFAGTRDIICPGWLCNWFFGGMQYQLEHHLFPTLPRVHYPQLAKEVEAFANKYGPEHGFQYLASPLAEFYDIHFSTLHRNAVAPAVREHCD